MAYVDLSPEGEDEAPPAAGTAPLLAVRRRLMTRVAGPCALVLVVLGLSVTIPAATLLGLVLATWTLLRRRVAGDVALAASVVLLLLATVLAGTFATAAGTDVTGRPALLGLLFLLYAGGSAGLDLGHPRAHPPTSPDPLRSAAFHVLTYGAAWVAVIVALVQTLRPGVAVSWPWEGTDFSSHLLQLKGEQVHGGLDYATNAYPQGFHLLAALVSAPGAPDAQTARDALLLYDTQVLGSLVWLSVAGLLAVGSALVTRVARLLRRGSGVGATGAALLGTVLLLLNSFLVSFVYMGAAPSLLAFAVLWTLPLACAAAAGDAGGSVVSKLSDTPGMTGRRGSLPHGLTWLVLLGGASTLVLAHLWQPLVVVPAAATAILLVPALRVRRPSRSAYAAGLLLLGIAGLTLVPVFALRGGGGLGIAAIAGGLPTPPWAVLASGALVVLALSSAYRRPEARVLGGSMLGLVVVVVVLVIGAGGGVDVSAYYPRKGLWFLTVFVAPFAALGAASAGQLLLLPVWRLLGRRRAASLVARATLVLVLTALMFAYALPPLLGTGSATAHAVSASPPRGYRVTQDFGNLHVGRERWDIAHDYGTRFAPAVTVPIEVGGSADGDPYGPNIVSKLIGFDTRQPQSAGGRNTVCPEIARVAGTARAVVITQLPRGVLEKLMIRGGCGATRVVHLPGGPARGSVLIRPH